MLVQVDLSVNPLAVDSLEATSEEVVVLKTESLGSSKEVSSHCGLCLGGRCDK